MNVNFQQNQNVAAAATFGRVGNDTLQLYKEEYAVKELTVMTKEDHRVTMDGYVKRIAQMFRMNTLTDILPRCAPNVVYISGANKVMVGHEVVSDFICSRQKAIEARNMRNYATSAVVTESPIDAVPVGTPCVVLSQFDPYNCTGFMVIELNPDGRIQKMHFRAEPEVRFRADHPDNRLIFDHVPATAREAIYTRARGFGVVDGNLVPSRHIQRYDVFHEWMRMLYGYIYYKLNNDFNRGIESAAGYVYTGAMITAVDRKRPFAIPFSFEPPEACADVIPDVPDMYREWIRAGYDMGKKLFIGFTEYVGLQNPANSAFTDQMMRSYLDLCLFGSAQANKDMDMGTI